ncbi:MAG TPA: adenylosuccinate lyase, partial [Bdellovibrionota bacterium]|nr:adenylosuccinate lyase [Bdellovibrionota bacterium]
QRILHRLIQKGLARERAYELVQRNALKASQTGEEFEVVVSKDPDIQSKLNDKEIREAFNPQTYVKEVDQTFRRVFDS